MDVYNDSLAKFRNLMKAKGPRKVVEEFSEFKDNSGVFMPDIITAAHHHSSYLFESFVVLESRRSFQAMRSEVSGNASQVKTRHLVDKSGSNAACWDEADSFDSWGWAA